MPPSETSPVWGYGSYSSRLHLHGPDTHHAVRREWQTTFRAEFHNGSYTDDDIVDVLTSGSPPFNIYRTSISCGCLQLARHAMYGTCDRRLTVQFYERFGSYYNGRLNELRCVARIALTNGCHSVWGRWNRLAASRWQLLSDIRRARDRLFVLQVPPSSTILQINTANAQAVERQYPAAMELRS
jgi:hypothetical protein